MESSSLSSQINLLFSEGKRPSQIAKILGCAVSMIRYHTDPEYKLKELHSRRTYKKKKRSAKKKDAIKLFGDKCQICGYNKCQNSLNFHHINPKTKEFGISEAFCKNAKTNEQIIEELKKCILVCANCHYEIHAGVLQIPETVKNPLTSEESMIECSCSLDVAGSSTNFEVSAKSP